MRELREFRAVHDEFLAAGTWVAGVSLDPLERAKAWAERLELPYPVLSDTERQVGEALGMIRRLGIGGWSIELLKRATILADQGGVIRAAWEDVKIKRHAREVLDAARALAGAVTLPAEPRPREAPGSPSA